MKSILLITQNYAPSKGGMANSCKRIVRNLRKRGVTVHVLHFYNHSANYEVKTELNGVYASLGIHLTEEFTLNLAQLFMESHAESLKFDAVIAFGGYLPLMWAPIVSKLFDKPLYTCIRGNDFDEFLFSKRRQMLLYALENSNKIFSVTKEKAFKIKQLVPSAETIYTPNGINATDWELYPSEQHSVDEIIGNSTKKIITIAGQLKQKKGTEHFLRNFENFVNKNNYTVQLVGDISGEISRLIPSLSYEVHTFPFADASAIKQVYHASDIVCIPSFYDGMPNVLLEAAACKCFILAANVGGISDVVEDGVSGILYHPLQKNSLSDAFFRYESLLKKEQITQIKQNIYNQITTCFTEEQEIENYINNLNLLS